MKRVVFLCSGGGGNLRFAHECLRRGLLTGVEIAGVIADRPCGALEYAKREGLDHWLLRYQKSESSGLEQRLASLNPDLIITTFHKILGPEITASYRGRLLNLHYSLLPAFPGSIGAQSVERALEAGCRFVGTTAHLVDEGVDTGEIVAQSCVSVIESEEFSVLMDRVFRSGCLNLLNAVQLVLGIGRSSIVGDDSYSPSLGFDRSGMDEVFWRRIA